MNYYEILEIHPKASKEVVRAAYKSLMQRHHPDKNPNNSEAVHHATLISQAYEIISDGNKRAIYDIQLQKQLKNNLSLEINLTTPIYKAHTNYKSYKNQINSKEKNIWSLGLLIFGILILIFLILLIFKKSSNYFSPNLTISASAFKPVSQPTKQNLSSHSENIKLEKSNLQDLGNKSNKLSEIQNRTMILFSNAITINLKGSTREEYILSIPTLLVKIGSFNSEKFISELNSRRDIIKLQLIEEIEHASYEELLKPGGENYLNKIVLEALEKILGTNRLEEYPSTEFESPSRYGIIATFFPESFSIK